MFRFGFAQNREISGTIADENGMPVPGASVLVKTAAGER
jgi:protocatechuate 3,4-dioxygenase beta subunit